jgi:hypothetical protein
MLWDFPAGIEGRVCKLPESEMADLCHDPDSWRPPVDRAGNQIRSATSRIEFVAAAHQAALKQPDTRFRDISFQPSAATRYTSVGGLGGWLQLP